jgi:uncharacterized protein YycO
LFNGGWWIDDYEYPNPLPQQPQYGSRLFTPHPGDIIYEEEGLSFVSGTALAGHIAIVEGKFKDSVYGEYWRLVESAKDGVQRSIFDDARMIEKKSHILYMALSADVCQVALDFCISQIGKGYKLQLDDRPTSSDKWMCSTLVWAASLSARLSTSSIPLPLQRSGRGRPC